MGSAWVLALVGLLIGGCASTVVDPLAAARQGDPEEMRVAITEIGEILYSMERNGVPYDEGELSAIEFLKETLDGKVDALNRAQALSALGRLKRLEVGHLFVRSLADPFWLVRFEAARAIYQNPRPQAAGPLIEQLGKERFVEVRIEIVRALVAVGTRECLGALLTVLLDNTGRYSAMKLKAYDGVVQLSGRTYPLEDVNSWKQFYDERFHSRESIETEGPPAPVGGLDDARSPESASP